MLMFPPLTSSTIRLNKVIYTNNPPVFGVEPTVHEAKKAEYLPEYKLTDKQRSYAVLKGLIKESSVSEGFHIINAKVASKISEKIEKIPCSSEEKARLRHLLSIPFALKNHGIDFGKKIIPTSFLQEALFNGHTFEMVGSCAKAALGVSFCKRVVLKSLEIIYKDPAEIKAIYKEFFTPEFEELLKKQFSMDRPDLDLRVKDPQASLNQPTRTLEEKISKILKLFKENLEFTPSRCEQLLQKIKQLHPGEDLNWLKIEDSDFVLTALRELALHNKQVNPKKGDSWAILTIGDENEMLLDLILDLEILRKSMTPQAIIPFNPQKLSDDDVIVPEGDWLQATYNAMFGIFQPDLKLATGDDFFAGVSARTKGEINPIVGSEGILYARSVRDSKDRENKVVSKLITKKPALGVDLEKMYPHYVVKNLTDLIRSHHKNHPLAAVIVTLNAVQMLFVKHPEDDIEKIIQEMSKHWNDLELHKHDQHLIYHLSKILAKNDVPLSQRLAFINSLAYMRCQGTLAESSDIHHLKTIPRKNEKTPCIEVDIKLDEKTTKSLMLNVKNVRNSMELAMKFLNHLFRKEERKSVEKLITAFFPENSFGSLASSPMLNDIEHYSPDLPYFEEAAQNYLETGTKSQKLFGQFLFLSNSSSDAECNPHTKYFFESPFIISSGK